MTTLNAAYRQGFRQGKAEAGGPPLVAAPYQQSPFRESAKYTAWVSGWAAARLAAQQRSGDAK